MRQPFSKTNWIEQYLFGILKSEEQQIFEAKMLIDPAFYNEVMAQKTTYKLLKKIGRKNLRKELDLVCNQLFTKPSKKSFQDKIKRIFF